MLKAKHSKIKNVVSKVTTSNLHSYLLFVVFFQTCKGGYSKEVLFISLIKSLFLRNNMLENNNEFA